MTDPSRTPAPSGGERLSPEALLGQVLDLSSGGLRHVERIAPRTEQFGAWPDWVQPNLYAALAGMGIAQLWSHQATAAELAHAGESCIITTGTASGKSLGYLLPVLTDLLDGLTAATGRGATALYLAPTKALGADQLTRVNALGLPGLRAATYDGDTPTDERRWIREHAHYVLTNPDLVHHSLLPGHERWAPFLRRLRYVVVDECHVYRGVLGSHVAAVLRRLRRVAAFYGAEPTFVLASATVAEPEVLGERLIGRPVRSVTEDGSPHAGLTFAVWEPPLEPDQTGELKRASALTDSAKVLAGCVAAGVQTVAFARSRAGVETLATAARTRLPARLEGGVAAYRGGYLPEERRELERALRSREIVGLAATNALELGVDISGLDAVVMAGWPGTLSSLWQQAGRAGRAGREPLVVFVAADDPLDAFVANHPVAIFGRPIEASVVDPVNPHVLAPHLAAAAAELPLTEADEAYFGATMEPLLDVLVARGILRRRPRGWFWARTDRPQDHLSLRGIGQTVRIIESRTGAVIGTVDEAAADRQVHQGAVHVHQGQSWVITAFDAEASAAQGVRGDPGWTTTAQSVSEFEIVREIDGVDWAQGWRCSFGAVLVSSQVTSFLRRLPSGEVIGEHPLELPRRTLNTRAVWWTMPVESLVAAGIAEDDIPGAAHAAEHAAIGLLPLIATADRWDIGGVSTALHPDTGQPTIMIYDGYPGGAGFADRGYRAIREWLTATVETIEACGCPDGCPSCVQSPKCGNGNNPLSKSGAVTLLRLALHCAGPALALPEA